MTLTEIKNSFFGYNKGDVCRYVSELNEIHSAETKAIEEKLTANVDELTAKNNSLLSENAELKEQLKALNAKLAELEAEVSTVNAENNELKLSYQTLENEVDDFKAKSEVISTAIINAERCAGDLIDDAKLRANDMVTEAEEKVNAETKRLVTAKEYISEIRASVALTMKNIDNVLAEAEGNIEKRKDDIEGSSDKKLSTREKFELLEKNIFKRA